MRDKQCTACSKVKAIDEFRCRARNKSGYDSICKDCSNFNQRHWRASNPGRVVTYRRNASEKRDSTAASARRRLHHLKSYGLTPEAYDAMLLEQGGVCRTCGKPEPSGRSLAIDHDHSCCPGKGSCGKCVRSLLCTKCNQGIGQADESIEILESWIWYLRFHGK